MEQFEYDAIGYWSEIKLDIVNQYAHKYTTILKNQRFIKKCLYRCVRRIGPKFL